MPKGNGIESDIKLSDFANASLRLGCSRISKQKAMQGKSVRESKNWWEIDEKDFDPFEDLETENNDDETEDSGVSQIVCVKKKHFTTIGEENDSYIAYSRDFYFLISSYVRPEDVCRFALISKTAYFVTRTVSFWRRMYRRYYKFSTELPERFRPVDIERMCGLRTCVIKSLFYMYPPYVERTKHPKGVSLCGDSIRKLCRSVCEFWWHEKVEARNPKGWLYYFKFSLISSKRDILVAPSVPASLSSIVAERMKSKNSLPQRLKHLDDIFYNSEEDCCVLKLYCTRFTNVPPVMGYRLSEVSVSLNSDMRTHRVKLGFESGSGLKIDGKTGKQPALGPKEVAVLDGVISLTLLDWWQPNYPSQVV